MIRKNILIALPNDMLGGAEQFLKMIATYYASMDNEVYIYFITEERFKGWSDLKENKNVHLNFGVGKSERKGASKFIQSLFKSRKQRFDLAITSHIHLTGIVGFLRRMKILKIDYFVGRESTSIFKRFNGLSLLKFKFFYFMGYKSLDLLICQTDFMKEQLLHGLPGLMSGLNVIVLHNPINLDGINNISVNEPILNMQRLPGKYIISAGRLIPEKGYDILLKAFQKNVASFPDVHLVILGEGEQKGILEELIISLNLKNKVSMPGRVENVYPYFKAAELCVVSSRVEGFPNVLLQMMSQNPNVISTTCAGGIDKIPSLPVCRPGDVDGLAILIKEALLTSENSRRLTAEQFKSYLEEHSLGNFMKKIDTYVSKHGA